MTPEEERALEYQRREQRRIGFQRSLQAKLKAPAEPARTTKENWKPLKRSC